MGAQSWTNTCGVCHVGGGQMEYDRDLNDYSAASAPGDAYVMKYARLDDPATPGIDETSWNNVSAGWLDSTNKGEMDCLMCHLDGSNAGSAWMKTLDCGPSNPIGPMTDPTCSGTPMYPGTRTVTVGDGVTDYDMFNRNFALKQRRNDLMASMGAGAKGVFTGTDLTGVDWGTNALSTGGAVLADGTCISRTVAYNDGGGCYDYSYAAFTGGACAGQYSTPYVINAGGGTPVDCLKMDSTQLAATPKSENCSVCHARDDNTMGLPGMMAMKTGYGNYGLIMDPSNPMTSGNMGASSDLDTDNGPGAANDDYWFDFGCKTGMGKRAHKIGATGDYIGPNARYGMSMFLPSTLDMDPLTVPNAGDPVPGKMPDVDVHDAAGMQCADCHYAVGSDSPDGYTDFPATTSHGFDYPAERIFAMDHQFAQADSLPDTKGKNNLDALLQCGKCHIERSHPNLTENGGTLDAPFPQHLGQPQIHQDRIGCVTCHVPETYSAPGRLKYRDWTVGFARGTFRNQLDWNFNLVEGNHNTVPTLRKWATKNGDNKIYPFLPSLLPTWYEVIPNSGVIADNAAGMPVDDNLYDSDTGLSYPSPVKNRDLQMVGEYVRDNNPQFDIRINGGNTVPLFDGFQIVDSWEIDTLAEIDAMLNAFGTTPGVANPATGADARYVSFLNVIQADFDVTHGIVPKEWALGGSERGGCVSCHSSRKQVLSVDPSDPANFMVPNPDYSPYSIGFFEGYTQPIDNKGLPNFGVGGSDVVKNWMALFADFDVTAMCGMGNPALTATDGMGGMLNPNTDHHNYYFNPLTGEPQMSNLCDANSWFSNNFMLGTAGWCQPDNTCYYDQNGDGTPETPGGACTPSSEGPMMTDPECNLTAPLAVGIGMMTQTFDAAMGFPSGTAMQMGMYDGVAGIQGFALKELQTGGTLGCNGFAGPVSFSPMPGMSVNNCMPNFADAGVATAIDGAMGAGTAAMYAGLINGTCVGAAPPTPGTCSGGFRGNGPCFADADCEGAMTDINEIFHNPFGLIMDRATAKSHFAIALEQGWKTPGDPSTPKVKWGAGGNCNPDASQGHDTMLGPADGSCKWDQAQFCYDYITGVNPMMPNVVPCATLGPAGSDGTGRMLIATGQSANMFLGYSPTKLATLMSASTMGITADDNTYNNGMHVTHLRLGASCIDCHTAYPSFTMTDGDTGTWGPGWSYSKLIVDTVDCDGVWEVDNADGITGTADDYTCNGTLTTSTTSDFGTCATACHPSTGSNPVDPQDTNVDAKLSALASIDTDLVITLDASRSTCDSSCTYAFDLSATDCVSTGGNGTDVNVVTCATAGSKDFSVTVTDVTSTDSEIATASADAENVTIAYAGTVNPTVVVNGDGTCTVNGPSDAVRARIYWGNRASTYIDPAADLPITDDCGSVVRIKLYDAAHSTIDLTF